MKEPNDELKIDIMGRKLKKVTVKSLFKMRLMISLTILILNFSTMANRGNELRFRKFDLR